MLTSCLITFICHWLGTGVVILSHLLSLHHVHSCLRHVSLVILHRCSLLETIWSWSLRMHWRSSWCLLLHWLMLLLLEMLVIVHIRIVSCLLLGRWALSTGRIGKPWCHRFHLHRLVLEETISVLGFGVWSRFQILCVRTCNAEVRGQNLLDLIWRAGHRCLSGWLLGHRIRYRSLHSHWQILLGVVITDWASSSMWIVRSWAAIFRFSHSCRWLKHYLVLSWATVRLENTMNIVIVVEVDLASGIPGWEIVTGWRRFVLDRWALFRWWCRNNDRFGVELHLKRLGLLLDSIQIHQYRSHYTLKLKEHT